MFDNRVDVGLIPRDRARQIALLPLFFVSLTISIFGKYRAYGCLHYKGARSTSTKLTLSEIFTRIQSHWGLMHFHYQIV